MKKSFTWLFSLVVLLGLFSIQASAQITADEVWPKDGDDPAYTKTTDKLKITFSEAVEASTGSIRLSEVGGGLLGVITTSSSSLVSISGEMVEVDLSTYLEEYTEYSVTVDDNAFAAVSDGDVLSADETWTFTTGDYTAPALTDVVPEDGTLYESEYLVLNLTFDDATAIQAGGGNIYVYKADGNIWDLVELDFGTGGNASISGSVLTVDNIRQLQDTESYYVTVDPAIVTDAGMNVDGEGIPYPGLMDVTAWTFGTVDFTAPAYASGYPKAANVGNDSFDILVKTNEDGTAYGVVLLESATAPADADAVRDDASAVEVSVTGGTVATLSFDGLSESTEYTAYIVVDNDDVETTVVKDVDVMTGETVPPVLTEVEYDYSSSTDVTETVTSNVVNVNSDVQLDLKAVVLTFDENIKLGAGNIIIKRVEDNTTFATISSDDMVVEMDEDVADHTWVKVPVSGLENDTEYYVVVPNTLVMDVYGNHYPGISSVTGWRFTASDDVAPTYTIVPAHASNNVKADAKIVLTFDELVNVTAGDFELEDEDEAALGFSFAQVNNDGKFTVVTLTPNADLPSGELVRVIIHEAGITDNDGNAVSDEDNTVAFFVEDHVGPDLSSWSPSSLELTSATKAIQIKYTEGIYLLGGTEITDDNLFAIVTVKEVDENGPNVDVELSINADKDVITITPVNGWDSEGQYYVAVTTDLEDTWGNAYEGSTVENATFTVKDLVPETVDINVAGKTIATGGAITVKFKEGSAIEARASYFMAGSWVAYSAPADMENVFILKEGDANGPDVPFTVTGTNGDFVVNASLDGNMTYYLGVGPATKDADGNINIPKYVTFNTLYEGVPEITSWTPAEGDDEIAVDADVTVSFNVDIAKVDQTTYDDVAFTGVTINGTKVAWADLKVTDNTLTIDHADFTENNSIEIIIASGVVLNDNSGTAFGGVAAGEWTFETVDTILDIVSLSNDESTTVGIDDELEITFGEDVLVGSGNIDIKNFNSDLIVERIDVTSDQVSIDDEVVTITPSSNFKYATKYYVEVSAGAFEDAAGNTSDAIYGKTVANGVLDWVFTVADPDLEIVKVTPADGSDKIAVTSSIVVEFNREIKAGTGAIGYVEDDGTVGGTQVQSYPIGSSNITIDGKTLTITHSDKDFPDDTQIWLYIESGSVVVATGAGAPIYQVDDQVGTESYSFNTGDVNPPVPTFDPEMYDGKTYVSVDADITIEFDEAIYHKVDGTVFTSGDITDDGIFELWTAEWNGTAWVPVTQVSFVGAISGNTVTMNPDVDLDEYQAYVVRIWAGADNPDTNDGVVDALDHEVPTTDNVFYTTDLTAPTVDVTLTGGAKKITVDVTTFTDAADNEDNFYYMVREKSDAPAPTAAEVIAANNPKDATAAILFDVTGLAASTTYQVFYVGEDSFENATAVAVKEATTDDTVAPVLVSSDPADGEADVDVSATGEIEIVLTFSEPVDPGTGTDDIVVRDVATNTIAGVYSSSSAIVSGTESDELVLTLTGFPTASAPIDIYVELGAGSVVDQATPSVNEFAGIFGEDAIYLTTEDNELPTFELDNSEPLAANEDLVVKFSEPVMAGTGTAILYEGASTAADDAVEVFTTADVTFDGKYVTINPSADLSVGMTYTLELNVSFALDTSANENGNAQGTLEFDVDENEAPYVEDINEPANPINKNYLQWVDVDMSEPIYFDIDGIRTNILLLTDAQIKANNLVSFVDGDGNPVPFDMVQCCDHDVVFQVAESDLEHSASYTLTIQGFIDIDGAEMDLFEYEFITTDGQGPIITFNPDDEEENIQPDSELTLTFSEQIYANAWYGSSSTPPSGVVETTLKSAMVNGDYFYYTPIDSNNVESFVFLRDESGNDVPFTATFNGVDVITIIPGVTLESGATYTYGLLQKVEDSEGNELSPSEGQGKSWAEFTVADVIEPVLGDVTASNFAPFGTGVSATADMWVKFSEEIEVSTGSVVIRYEDGTIFQTVSGADLWVDEDYPTYLMIEHNNFEPYTTYFVELEEGVVVDGSGNPNAAYSDAENGWVFTTNDTFDLVAQATPQGDGQPSLVDLVLEFNKNNLVRNTSDYGYYLAVYKEDGSAVAQISINDLVIVGNKVTYYNLQLEEDQAYYARIEPNAIKDGSGNKFAGIMDDSWSFSTMASIAPNLVSTTPEDDNISVDPATSTFTMTFDRDIALGTGMISVRYSSDGSVFEEIDVTTGTVEGSTITFELTQMMEENTAYYVLVSDSAITNTEVTADAFAGIDDTYSWNFTTGEEVIPPVVPELVEWTPQDTIADSHATFVMTFADTVMLAADSVGYLTVTEMDSTDATLTIEITADMVDGNVVTVDYDTLVGRLWTNTTYIVNVDGGILVNAEGNAFAGVSDDTTWTFTTGPVWATPTEPEIELVDFNMYPNPFTDHITIENNDKVARLIMVNIAGQRVMDVEYPSREISTGNLVSGVYVISLITEDGQRAKTERMIKR